MDEISASDLVARWQQQFDDLNARIAPRFARSEARQQAKAYLQALLSQVDRKNGWQMAEALGYTAPYGLQHLLGRANWNADALQEDLQQFVHENLGDDDAVLVVDETGFLKKGEHSAGVARQYSGTAGRIENCQIGVFLCYASYKGAALIDRRLYLPKEWIQDTQRCQRAGIPEEAAFVTKPKMARAMLERAFEAGLPARWVTGDSVYGNDRGLQIWLQERHKAYVLAVTGQETVFIGWGSYRVKQLLSAIADDAWQVLSCGQGSKGERFYEWFWQEINCPFAPEWKRWLLARRSLSPPKDPTKGREVTGYVAFAPASTSLETLVRVAGSRWHIESCFEAAKGEVGLDEYEVRSFRGWYRHVTLSLLALAFLAVARAHCLDEASEAIQETPPEQDQIKKGNSLPSKRTGSLTEFKQRRGLLLV